MVYDSPAYTTSPIRSLIRSDTKVWATSFKAVNRLGLKSRDSILDEMSIAITMSIPFVVLVRLDTLAVRGRARATINRAIADKRSTHNNGYMRVQKVGLSKPSNDDIRKTLCFFCGRQNSHAAKNGMMANAHRKDMFAKV